MDKGKIIYVLVMGWSLLIFGGITYLIAKIKDYTLLSGYNNRPEEEKQYLQEHGYLDAVGKWMTISFWLFALTFVVGLFPIPFGFEITIELFLVYFLIGMVWTQRYEVPHKRKKMTWITGSIAAFILLFVVGITALGYLDNEYKVSDEKFEITGMYGIEWDITEINDVKLLEELPKVIIKTNGFATTHLLKGHFKLEEPYGKGRLFIQKNKKNVLYVAAEDEYVMISRKEEQQTKELYNQLFDVLMKKEVE